MPEWSDTDRRMYEHIRDSAEERGTNDERAEEIAARTVNKHRREEGRTPNRRTQGTGNPRASLEEHTVDELQNQAKELGIKGRSRLRKSELIDAIRDKQ